MTNVNFKVMLHTMSALDEPIRRKRPHKKPKQAETWQKNRQARRKFKENNDA